MNDELRTILSEYVDKVKAIYAGKLSRVILYGSYARGDYTEDSDIDIMVLVEDSDDNVRAKSEKLSFMTYDFNMDHSTDIHSISRSRRYFEYWDTAHPFYKNVKNEGIMLYEGA